MYVADNEPFPVDKTYDTIFSSFASFPLSDFQKWAIKAIVEGDHSLITAHTGSGKTLPAEFMIKHFTTRADDEGRERKRVIYASPIKALSNQKLYDMRNKFPEVSFGLLTGDCKDNPEADVLIVTTEILRNTLFNKLIAKEQQEEMPLAFDLDIEKDLGGVIFDEVHYINDADRGSVWEQSIMLLPPQVQMLMLSATIDNAQDFAQWVETEKNKQATEKGLTSKEVVLASTSHRVVPLTHYMWCHVNPGLGKKVRDDPVKEKMINGVANRMITLKEGDGQVVMENVRQVAKVLQELDYLRIKPKRSAAINGLVKHLKENGMLPAICFVFSRKNVEIIADEMACMNLFDEGDPKPAQVERECRRILAERLTNYKEYLALPEYQKIINLLQHGIAIHHAGVMTVLREMVELLFERGYIKMLVATETFAVGINMPTKTVVFTSVTKFDGREPRPLYPHEYTQMAGRAGRRGIDTVGQVIHCSNLIPKSAMDGYTQMLCGGAQKLRSKFKISYGLVLNVIASGHSDTLAIEAFVRNSMLGKEIQSELLSLGSELDKVRRNYDRLEKAQSVASRTPMEIILEYKLLSSSLSDRTIRMRQKQRKNAEKRAKQIEDEHPHLSGDLKTLTSLEDARKESDAVGDRKDDCESFFPNAISEVTTFLTQEGFLTAGEGGELILTASGRAAGQLQEVHPLVVGNLIVDTDYMSTWTAEDIVALLSMFTQIKLSDEIKRHSSEDEHARRVHSEIDRYADHEARSMIPCSADHDAVHFDLMDELRQWCQALDEAKCANIIDGLKEKGIFLGDFVKAILKINNIASELEKVAEAEGRIAFLEKLRTIPTLTMKYVATNQSLYI
jgi:superfamily II RNA helicase